MGKLKQEDEEKGVERNWVADSLSPAVFFVVPEPFVLEASNLLCYLASEG